ncbi:MAG TPA: ATP-binding protein, partial [Thermodesulfobacteriota bacterium]
MCAASALPAADLYRRCDPNDIPFATTDEAVGTTGMVGQERAVEAVRFGLAIRHDGYNLFAMGPPGVGKQTLLREVLGPRAAAEPTPPDRCYVHNFADAHRPRVLSLPPGRGSRLRDDMQQAIADIRDAMRAAFDSEEYRTRKQQMIARFNERQARAFAEVQERARQRGIAVVRTEGGLVVAPLRDGAPLGPAELAQLSRPEQARIQAEMERVGADVQAFFQRLHEWGHEQQEAMKGLDRETSTQVARRVLDGVRARYRDLPEVLGYLDEVERDVIDSAGEFLEPGPMGFEALFAQAFRRNQRDGAAARRYAVNVLVDNGALQGAPIVYEDHPTYTNLVGRIEHVAQFGALLTDVTLIKAGALHRASGGYLILDARKVLQQPFAWEALKRTIRSREIRMEPPAELLAVVPTVTLKPEPIPFDGTKVILVGERLLYHLLAAVDPDVAELFKVVADFEESLDRRPETHALYANLIATLVRREGLRPFDRSAVARVLEHAARLAGDAEKLSVHMRPVADLLREAEFHAEAAAAPVVSAEHVQAAIDAQHRRTGRVRERLIESIRRGTILIDTAGATVGQVNGLSVIQLGETAFGHPARITARVRVGKGEVVDIQREVELGGPIHSKGVLILGGFLGARYASHAPLSLTASLVFEQTYGAVD